MSNKLVKNQPQKEKRVIKNIIIRVVCIAFLIAAIVGCVYLFTMESDRKDEESSTTKSMFEENPTGEPAKYGDTVIPEEVCQYLDPVEGEIVASIYIRDYGVVKVKFFETLAPKAVERQKDNKLSLRFPVFLRIRSLGKEVSYNWFVIDVK